MLRPFLLVGVGGSGGKTLRAVRQGLKSKLQQEGWTEGIPEAWQFLHIDSPLAQDGLEFPAGLLPSQDYLSLVPNGVNYANVYNSITQSVDSKNSADILKPLPSEQDVTVPISQGAGKYRAIGRTIAVAGLSKIQARAASAFTRMQTATADAQLSKLTKHLGLQTSAKLEPVIIIVSSIAGGSGAGMFIDATEAVKAAAAAKTWAEHSFAILYAPDVFKEIDASGAIAANALAAISETMSGYWNISPSESTQALYKSAGLIPAQTAASKIGPAYSYIVGRTNGSVDFGTQSGVYKAVSASICTWMTDDKVQDDMSAYAIANRGAKATPLQDKTGLKRASSDTPPFSSLGFSRVSLGMEKFVDYASERLAKQTLKTILEKHLEQDPGLKEKTEEQWRIQFADASEGRFLADSKLNELTENNNDIIDALTPKMDEPVLNFKNAIQAQVEGAVKPAGVDLSTWVSWITNAYEVNLSSALESVSQMRNDRIRKWVEEMPNHIMKLVTSYISEQGLPVTVELTKRLIEQCKRAQSELLDERTRHLADASQVQVLVSAALNPVATQAAIPKNHPAIATAYQQAQVCFATRAYADLKGAASQLMTDFVDNFMEPLFKELASAQATLKMRVDDPKLLDQRENPYSEWPDFKSTSVPQRYKPAPNERLLIDYTTYPAEFDKLVLETISDSAVDAKRKVVDEVIVGKLGVESLQNLEPEQTWSVLNQSQIWIPAERSFQVKQASPSPARFEFAVDHMQYLDFTYLWLNIPGRRFKAYLDQKIASYLGDDSDKSEQAKRQSNFIKEFTAAVASSSPLVEFDSALLTEVHTTIANEKSVIFSAIPVEPGDTLYEAMKDVLVNYGYWNDNSSKWFQGAGNAANVRTIDIFTQTGYPVQPIVMSSVMQPISEAWSSDSDGKDSRANFLKWRRGRTLSEFIPAHPDVWRQMLRGWYVARLLNLLKSTKDEATFDQKGPEVSVWVDPGMGHVSFPYPLMNPNPTPIDDLPGVVLESMAIALVNGYAAHSLKALLPYQRLFKLGGSTNQLDRELQEWIISGKPSQSGTPAIDENRAGSASDTIDGRKDKSIAYLEGELQKFQTKVAGIDRYSDLRTYPVSWEIRGDIEKAIHEVIAGIRATDKEEEL